MYVCMYNLKRAHVPTNCMCVGVTCLWWIYTHVCDDPRITDRRPLLAHGHKCARARGEAITLVVRSYLLSAHFRFSMTVTPDESFTRHPIPHGPPPPPLSSLNLQYDYWEISNDNSTELFETVGNANRKRYIATDAIDTRYALVRGNSTVTFLRYTRTKKSH